MSKSDIINLFCVTYIISLPTERGKEEDHLKLSSRNLFVMSNYRIQV